MTMICGNGGMRRAWACGFLLLTASTLVAGNAVAQEQPAVSDQHDYQIAADRLDSALARYASISKVDILYDEGLARGRRSTAVSGRYSPPQALAILLRGTGLSWRFTKARAVVIYAESADAAGSSPVAEPFPVLVLDTLNVRVSPIIGKPSRAAFTAYGEWVLTQLYRRITPERDQRRPFRGEIQFWIDEQGTVSRLDFIRRTGDSEADRLIETSIVGTRFERLPPPGLPQPLRFMVEGRR